MESTFAHAADTANICLEKWPSIIKTLQTAEAPGGERFNQEQPVPGTDLELRWFDERVRTVCGLISGLSKIDSDKGIPIPIQDVENIDKISIEIRNSIVELERISIRIFENKLGSLNPGNWIIKLISTNEEVNIASHLQPLKELLELQLKQYIGIAVAVQDASFSGFFEATREFSETAGEIRNNAAAASEAAEETSRAQKEAQQLKAQAEADRADISEALKSANEILSNVDEINANSREQLKSVEEISGLANNLKTHISQY